MVSSYYNAGNIFKKLWSHDHFCLLGFLETSCGWTRLSLTPPDEYYGNMKLTWCCGRFHSTLFVCQHHTEQCSSAVSLSANQLPVRWFHSCLALTLCVCVFARVYNLYVCVFVARACCNPPTHTVSLQSLPSLQLPTRPLKSLAELQRRSEHWSLLMMMMMDRRRMMEDADGGGRVLVHRERRTRWLAVVVAVQNVLVTLSLVVTLYVYLDVKVSYTEESSIFLHVHHDEPTVGLSRWTCKNFFFLFFTTCYWYCV